MAEFNFFKEFINLNSDINLKYRESKYPKFIKNYILKRDRKKLKKIVNNLKSNSDCLSVQLLSEFYDVVYDAYPPFGKYVLKVEGADEEGIYKISPIDKEKLLYAISYVINKKDTYNIIASFASYEKDNSSYIAKYVFRSKNNEFEFIDENIDSIKIDHNISDMYINKETVRALIANSTLKLMCQYLEDIIERSERINL